MKINFTKEWCMKMADAEGDAIIGACVPTREDMLEDALRRLTFMARTTGGVAGRDEGLREACDAAEALLAMRVITIKPEGSS